MIISTTDGIEGRSISAYSGIVSGEAVMGTNIFRDMFASIRDIVGGRSGSYEKELRNARRWPWKPCRQKPKNWGQMLSLPSIWTMNPSAVATSPC